jgi:cysteine protease avirulence protein AvrRpt2
MQLNVTFYSQLKNLPIGPPEDDEVGCWYSCAKMIGVYWDGNPLRVGVPELTTEKGTHKLLGRTGEVRLAVNEKYVEIRDKLDSTEVVDAVLTKYGPILFFIGIPIPSTINTEFPQVFGHALLIVGTNPVGRAMVYHDPARGPNLEMGFSLYRIAREQSGATRVWARDPSSTTRLKRRVESDGPRGIAYPGQRLKPR